MKASFGLLPIWLLLGALTPARAATSPGQLYDSYICRSYPEIDMLERAEAQTQRFPQLDSGSPSAVNYGELAYHGGALGLITCTAARDGYASLIYFSSDGRSLVVHYALPVRAGQQVTLSCRLPSGGDGVSLLLLWSQPPDQEALIGLAVDPNSALPQIDGVREVYWLPRVRPALYFAPWSDPLRSTAPKGEPPGSDWPWCSARLTAGYQTVAKDCAVDFSGLTSLQVDQYGAFGQWRLDWASELTLYCELPSDEDWDGVELWLYGDEPQFGQALDLSLLELEINGWPVRLQRGQYAGGDETKHIALDLSQYLHGGSNRIRLRLSSLAGSEWLIHGIEVWMY